MLTKSTLLKFYKQINIQQAMLEHAENKELGTRYADYFGKRPDILSYPRDIIELALQGVTSFHISEEIWSNPLALGSNLTKKDLEELRQGWDLVLDIDCPDWEISKITTYLFIKSLKANEVKSISCKFSGNKGFHIGVPFEAFPKEVAGEMTKNIFPKGPKKIAEYLLNYITDNFISIKDNKVVFDDKYSFTLNQLKEKFGDREFLINRCSSCKQKISLDKESITEFICPKCDKQVKEDAEFLKCDKCNILMEKIENNKTLCKCGSNEYHSFFNPASIIEVDTILISSRHLYRMPYSLHEKSGLVSLPIDPEKVMEFEKQMADPNKIITSTFTFLDRNIQEESARRLLVQALDFEVKVEEEYKPEKEYDEMVITSPITEEFFPPCIKQILNGLGDGRKRAVFCLINFLGKIGWNKNDIEDFVKKWNSEKNPDPLREVYIKGQLNHFKPGERLPPNCNNDGYYKEIGVKCEGCLKFKNPVNYTLWRWRRYLQDHENNNGKKDKKTKEKDEIITENAHKDNEN
ncbi:MAG: DNA primase small subunit domain-containing protein [Candidatus Woesearchaeota archaeon]